MPPPPSPERKYTPRPWLALAGACLAALLLLLALLTLPGDPAIALSPPPSASAPATPQASDPATPQASDPAAEARTAPRPGPLPGQSPARSPFNPLDPSPPGKTR